MMVIESGRANFTIKPWKENSKIVKFFTESPTLLQCIKYHFHYQINFKKIDAVKID